MAMEVGNLAATEQDRALHLIADPYGGLHGLPDSIEVARKKHVLLGEFLKAGWKARRVQMGKAACRPNCVLSWPG